MRDFQREAERRGPRVHPFGIDKIGKQGFVAKALEKMGKEGIERVGEKAPIYPNGGGAVRQPVATGGIVLEHHPFTEGDQVIVACIQFNMVPEIVVPVAGAAERDDLPLDGNPADFTSDIALFLAALADERRSVADLPVDQCVEGKNACLHKPLTNPILHFEGHTVRPHESGFRRNDNLLSGKGRHGDRNRPVVADASLHEDLLADRARALHPVHIVHADRIDQASHRILFRHPFVGRVLDVGRDERGALVVEVGRNGSLHGPLCNLLHLNSQRLLGGLFEKGSGSGRARFVHGIIRCHPVGDERIFCILPANFKNGIHFVVEIDGRCCVRDNLVDHPVGHRMQSRNLSARACNPKTLNHNLHPAQLPA